MHRDSRSAHVCCREAHEFAEGHVPTPVTRVPTLAVADGELDVARMITWLDQPLAVGRDGALRREYGSCQEAGQEQNDEPHRDSGNWIEGLDRRRDGKVVRRRKTASNRDVEQRRDSVTSRTGMMMAAVAL